MSLKLYTPATKSGIIDLIYSNTGADATKYPLMEVVRDINLAKDKLISIAIPASGKWQLDDSGHTDYPIISTDLISGQRDYSFTTDEQGNLILDIYRVMVADANGVFHDLQRVDQQDSSDPRSIGFVDGQNKTGKPSYYDKTANGIFLDVIPDYNMRLVNEGLAGIKIMINREGLHYSVPTINVADTTTSGIDPRLDEYLAIRPTAYFAAKKGLKSAGFWMNELLKYEGQGSVQGLIEEIYGQKSKDERPTLMGKLFNFR
jgi:hypothetical protein